MSVYFKDVEGNFLYPFSDWDISGIIGTHGFSVDNDFEAQTLNGGTVAASVNLEQVVYGHSSGQTWEIIGTWDTGIWYYDVAKSKWTKMHPVKPDGDTPSGDIEAGDFTCDGIADVASCWDSGLRYQNGATLSWENVYGIAPYRVTVGAECTASCMDNSECDPEEYCAKPVGECNGPGVCSHKPEVCLWFYDPVCGCDGNTYSNECCASGAGVNVAYKGECTSME